VGEVTLPIRFLSISPRRRLIAGSPHLIAKLLREEEQQAERSIHSVIAKPRGTHVRAGATSMKKTIKDKILKLNYAGNARYAYPRAKWSDYCFPIDGLAPTVIARHAHVWITGNGEGGNRSVMHPSELAALQTFPPGYKLPTNKYQAYLQVGNAVPPRVAELILRGESRCASPASPSLRRPPGPIGGEVQ
jgi:site-specific DNA-cytosine methylase